MAESKRERILDNCVTTLQSITSGGGYFNSLTKSQVRRSIPGLHTVITFPSFFVIAGPRTPIESSINFARHLLNVSIQVWVRGDRELLPKLIEQVLADAEKAMKVDPTRNGLALDTKDGVTNQPALEEIQTIQAVVCDIAFDIDYRTTFNDPSG